MRKFVVLVLAVATAWYLTLGGGLQRYEEYRVKGALIESGVPGKRADCMARRMVKRLSLPQLWKLQRFSEDRRNLRAYLRGVRRVGDAEAISVTVSSGALCAVGVAH